MNTLFRSLAAANGVRLRLGEGEPGLMPLLGGFSDLDDDSPFSLGGGGAGADSRIAILRRDVRVSGGSGSAPSTGGGPTGGGDPNCPGVDMRLPGGLRAGDVKPGDQLELVDPLTGERRLGRVTFSATRMALCFRIEWHNGVVLVCSDTAPIPTADGTLRTPLELCGEESLTQLDGALRLSAIVRVQRLGLGWVQHITCENACFLVGATDGAYGLHHNTKPRAGT